MEGKMGLAIAPKNSPTHVPLFIFKILFFSEEHKLSFPLGQCADMAASKHSADPQSEVSKVLLTQQCM